MMKTGLLGNQRRQILLIPVILAIGAGMGMAHDIEKAHPGGHYGVGLTVPSGAFAKSHIRQNVREHVQNSVRETVTGTAKKNAHESVRGARSVGGCH